MKSLNIRIYLYSKCHVHFFFVRTSDYCVSQQLSQYTTEAVRAKVALPSKHITLIININGLFVFIIKQVVLCAIYYILFKYYLNTNVLFGLRKSYFKIISHIYL